MCHNCPKLINSNFPKNTRCLLLNCSNQPLLSLTYTQAQQYSSELELLQKHSYVHINASHNQPLPLKTLMLLISTILQWLKTEEGPIIFYPGTVDQSKLTDDFLCYETSMRQQHHSSTLSDISSNTTSNNVSLPSQKLIHIEKSYTVDDIDFGPSVTILASVLPWVRDFLTPPQVTAQYKQHAGGSQRYKPKTCIEYYSVIVNKLYFAIHPLNISSSSSSLQPQQQYQQHQLALKTIPISLSPSILRMLTYAQA